MLLTVITLAAACAQQPPPTSTTPAGPAILFPTPNPASTPHSSSTPTPAAIPTEVPKTRTPSPALPPQQERDYWISLLRTNGGCELPCWLGLEPGHATYADFDMLFAPIGAVAQVYSPSSEGIERQRNLILGTNGQPLLYSVFEEKDGVIHGIRSVAAGPRRCSGCTREYAAALATLSPQAIMQRVGTPSRVLLSMYTGPVEPGADWWYVLWLLYDDTGISVTYQATGLTRAGDTVRVCPTLDAVYTIYLDVAGPPSESVFDEDIAESRRSGGPPLLTIEEAASLSPSDFKAALLSGSSGGCFSTPLERW